MRKGPVFDVRKCLGLIALISAALAEPAAVENGLSGFESINPKAPFTASQGAKRTVWDRVFTEEQATRGQQSYYDECTACHLENLVGDGYAAALVGEDFSIRWNGLSVADLFTKIAQTMPQGDPGPGSLSPQVYIDIVAYLLKMNGIPAGDSELSPDAEELKEVLITDKPEG